MPLWLALLAAMVCATQPKQQRCRARPELHFVAVQSVHGILVLTRQLQQQPATSAAACSVLHSKLEACTFVDPRCIACAEQVMLFSDIKRMRRDHVNICFAPKLVSHQRCSSENPREVLLDRSLFRGRLNLSCERTSWSFPCSKLVLCWSGLLTSMAFRLHAALDLLSAGATFMRCLRPRCPVQARLDHRVSCARRG